MGEFFIIIFSIVLGIVIFVVAPNILQEAEKGLSISLRIDYDFYYIRYLALFLLLVCTTSLLYYALPNSKQKFSQTVPGSILAVILWFCLQHAFAIYLDNFHYILKFRLLTTTTLLLPKRIAQSIVNMSFPPEQQNLLKSSIYS